MKEEVKILEKIVRQYDKDWRKSSISWSIPKGISADLSLNISSLKKKEESVEMVKSIINSFNQCFPTWEFEVVNDYINIKLPLSYYCEFLTDYFWRNWNLKEKEEKKVIIEFVSANPTGFLHLAHFRQAFIGDALANIYGFQGYKVTREYYINDKGNQIKDLADSVFYYYQSLSSCCQSTKKEEEIKYPGISSRQAAIFLKKKWKDRFFKDKGECILFKKEIISFMLRKIRLDLSRCKVFFDKWVSEEELFQRNKSRMKKALLGWEKKKLVYWNDGSLFFKSTLSEDDKDRVLIKRNGEYTYFLNDIFYHQEKLSRAQLLITVLGPDHHGYVQRLLNACFFLLNYSKDNITIIMTEMINLLLPEGTKTKFSKRAGNTISLTEALKHIQINQLKFFCLEKDHRREINLNKEVLEEKQEKSLLYYIHYAVVRCFQIIKKTQEEKHLKELNFSFNFQRENWLKNGRALKLYALQTIASKDFKLNLEEEDREICNVISQFFLVLENVLTHNQPHILIYYLLKLSKCWQIYYQKNVVLDVNNIGSTKQRLCLTKIVQIVLCTGLRLLGFYQIPSQM